MHILRYSAIVAHGEVRRPLASSLLGRIPDSIVSVALVLLAHSSTGSYSSAGLVAGGFALGSALGAPIAGKMLDRRGQRRVLPSMVVAFAGGLIAATLMAGHVSLIALIGLACVAGVSRPPLESAMRALWAAVIEPAELQRAYALDATTQELIWIAGPLLLSALLVAGGPALALVACAALSLVGTILYAGSRAVKTQSGAADRNGRHPLGSTGFASLLVAASLYGAAAGALTVSLTAFCSEHATRAAVGVAIAIWGVGSIVGGIAYGNARWAAPPARRALLLLSSLAAALAMLAAAPSFAVLAPLMFVLGLPLSPWLGTLSGAVQAIVPARRASEAFSWVYAVTTAGIAAGDAAGGPVVQVASPASGFLLAAVLAAAGAGLGGLGLLASRHLERTRWSLRAPHRASAAPPRPPPHSVGTSSPRPASPTM